MTYKTKKKSESDNIEIKIKLADQKISVLDRKIYKIQNQIEKRSK